MHLLHGAAIRIRGKPSRFEGGSPSFSPVKKTGAAIVKGFSRDLGLNLAENELKRDFSAQFKRFCHLRATPISW